MLKSVHAVLRFVPDVDAAARWYAELLAVEVEHEHPLFAFVRGPGGVVIGFHPADSKCPGGVGGTTVYWEVDDLAAAVEALLARGATLHRGPIRTALGAHVATLVDPFGCTIGLNESSAQSRSGTR